MNVLWPAPRSFADQEGKTIGYEHNVVLPLQIERRDTAKPAVLNLKLDYAVCEKLCVPLEAKIGLALAGTASAHDAVVTEAFTRVPKAAAVGAAGTVAIVSVQQDRKAAPQRIVVEVAAPSGATVALFAEGPNANWALPLPEPIAGAPNGRQRFAFALEGLPAGEQPHGAVLRLTAVAGKDAVETTYRLD